jgi:predicted nucleotidyltransferase
MAARSRPSVGPRVAAARRERGLTQARLAQSSSLDRTALSKIEHGHRTVGALELARIARALGRPLEWFLADRGPAEKRPLVEIRKRRRAIARIAARHGANSLRVFGSFARSDARPESDIDILVRMERGRSLFDQAALLVELRDLLGRDVDVVTEEGLRGSIRERVLREAVPL